MKIQKLIIHNIASIEDATIDFEQEPLANSEVFLITGKTGSGKSTILDAICLALYADTPRLDNTKMQGDVDDTGKDIKIDDPRQLMRRNTGEAYTTLTFTGMNGVRYEATWSIARARKKPDGTLQSKDWTLKNLDTGKTLSKDKDIVSEIKTAVGLDFQQFCRTTMLAQGEFTRFLNSSDNEKAAILEKITGVDIYSKIGMKVYQVANDKKYAYEVAKANIEGTNTFLEEEIQERNQRINDLDTEYNTKKTLNDSNVAKRDWLKTENDLSAKVGDATSELQKAKQIVESEGFKQKETLIQQWNSTIDARKSLMEKNKAQGEQQKQETIIETLSNEYASLIGGQQFDKQEAAKIESQIKSIDTFLENEKDKVPVYEQAQTIIGHLGRVIESRKSIETNNEIVVKEQKELENSLLPALNAAQSAEKSAKDAFEKQELQVKNEEKSVEDLKLPELRTQRDEYSQLIGKISTAKVCLSTLANEEARMAKTKQDLEEREEALAEKRLQSSEKEQPLHDAEVIMNSKKEDLDKQKDTIDKFAKALRSKLHVGDVCPVCRQKVAAELPHEDELSKLISELDSNFKQVEKAYNDLRTEKMKIDAEIKTASESYEREKKSFEADNSVDTANAKALEACRQCGIETIDSNTPVVLDNLEKNTTLHKEELEKQIKNGEEKEKATKKLRNALESKRKEVESLNKDTQKAEQAVADCKNRIQNAGNLVSVKKNELQTATENAQKLIGSSNWNHGWRASTDEFIEELRNAANTYSQNIQSKNKLDTDFRSITENCHHVAEAIDKILNIMPQWSNIQALPATKIDKLLENVNDVYAHVSTALDKLKTAKNTYSEADKLLSAFYHQHAEITLERLGELNAYTSEKINKENALLDVYRKDVATKKGALNNIAEQQKEHQQSKPKLTEEDTIETLENCMAELGQKLREITEQKGAIIQELATNEENKKNLADKIDEAKSKEADYQKWDRLNQLIGDASGNKFRKIAQSYILGNLIHSANHYMKMLNNRYTLKVQPGTFVILIEDAYQCYATRAVSTISGGESFLVSLALALALSDIGQSISTDTLFIDEGFGTLSGEPLQNAVNTLRTLHSNAGRHVGIISHVEELQERIPVQIQVVQDANNSNSIIRIVPD